MTVVVPSWRDKDRFSRNRDRILHSLGDHGELDAGSRLKLPLLFGA